MLPRLRKVLIFIGLLLLAMGMGWVDLLTGYPVSVLAFYALPIFLAVWWVGNLAGFGIALASAIICFYVRRAMPDAPPISHGVELWNGAMRLATFLIFCGGAAAMRFQVETLRRQVKILTGVLPICNCCKKIRDEQGYWNDLELYLNEHSEAGIAQKLCPDCSRKLAAGQIPQCRPVGAVRVSTPSTP